jgi:hypothetical protein
MGLSIMPFKHNADRRHHIPKMRLRVTNWRQYEVGLRRRGSLTRYLKLRSGQGSRRFSVVRMPSEAAPTRKRATPPSAPAKGRISRSQRASGNKFA